MSFLKKRTKYWTSFKKKEYISEAKITINRYNQQVIVHWYYWTLNLKFNAVRDILGFYNFDHIKSV